MAGGGDEKIMSSISARSSIRSAPEMIEAGMVKAPDREAERGAQRDQRQQRHDPLAHERGAQQPDEQHDQRADGQGDGTARSAASRCAGP